MSGAAFVVGTFDTKAEELVYVADLVRRAGPRVVTVDVSTGDPVSKADVAAADVAAFHPQGAGAVLAVGDRGKAVSAMATALTAFIAGRDDLGGIIGLGGSGGTSIITPAMRSLPIGLPKLMVSTLASGDVGPYVDISDITMMFPVTDIAGLNRLSRTVLANAANALAGMMTGQVPEGSDEKPSIGVSMFGVTTPCVQQLNARLSGDFDCQVFHANGPGGRAFEALASAGMLSAMVDLTTTEAADHLLGGVCSAGPQRLDVLAPTGIPWIGSCGALDMVNFWTPETIPERYRGRHLFAHNANVTLMRTTADELVKIAGWITAKLNRSPGPVRLLVPEGGVSALDRAGEAFHDPDADAALFDALEEGFVASESHRFVRVPHHINDVRFVEVVEQHVRDLLQGAVRP